MIISINKMTTELPKIELIEKPEIEEDQKIINDDFIGIFEENTLNNKPLKLNTLSPKKTPGRSKIIVAEGLTLSELSDKYIELISVKDDIQEIVNRVFNKVEKTSKTKSRKSRFSKKLTELFNKKVDNISSTTPEAEEEVIRLKPKPDISIHKSKLIGQIKINYGVLGVVEPDDLEKKTEGELEKILVTSVKQMDNSYTALNLRDIGYFLLESGASISENVKPELFSGLKNRHVENKENLKQIIGSCMNEYEQVIKKYASPINILALKLGTIYAETALSNINKNKS